MKDSKHVGERWQRRFFSVWGGQAVSLFGSNLVQFGLVWWLTESTGSATVLAMATLVALLPSVFLSPFAGALVDRWNRRRVLIVADTLIALVTVGLAGLFLVGAERVWLVYLVMFLRAAGGSFHWPAMQASTSLMVPEQHLSRIAGLNQSLRGAVGIVAPPAGALLLQILPLQAVLAIDVGTALFAIVPLFFVHIPQPASSAEGDGALPDGALPAVSLLEDVRQGFRYVRGWPGLFAILVMATVINFLLTPASSLMPLLVTDHFGGEALELGWLQSAWGGGVVAGGLILGAWGGFRRRILTSLLGLVGIGVGFLLVGLLPPSGFILAVGGIFLAGTMNPITNGPLFSIVQAEVAPDMQGRVFTLIQSMATAATPLGMLIGGPVADAFGVRVWYLVGGLGCALMGISGFFMPVIVNLEDHQDSSCQEAGAVAPMASGCADVPGVAE